MNRTDFLNKLERSLSGSVPVEQIRSDVLYYENYIDAQIRNGRPEAEVLAELGDPRLIAKSIIDANERSGGATYAGTQEAEFQEKPRFIKPEWIEKIFEIAVKMPRWLWAVILGTLLLIVLAIATSLISVLLPILLPVLCIILVVQVLKRQ